MPILQKLLHITNFGSPLLRTVVPAVCTAFAIQTAFAIPSVAVRSERLYDLSGAITNVAVVALSLYLPALRARHAVAGPSAAKAGLQPFPSPIEPFTSPATAALNWRQMVLSAAVTLWAARLGTYLFGRVLREGKDSRFDALRDTPRKFLAAWAAQAVWCTAITLPVVALNAVPAPALSALPVLVTDVVGLALWAGGLAFESAADAQKARWVSGKKEKLHDEEFMTRGLWRRCRYPNYFGETALWAGIATAAAGPLVACQTALGLGAGAGGAVAAGLLPFVSPAFTAFVLLKLSGVPLSEPRYDRKYGDRKEYQEWKAATPMFFPKIFLKESGEQQSR